MSKMRSFDIPDLTFPEISYGKFETPRDLRSWLYRGGAGLDARTVISKIESGELGQPCIERIELVRQIHLSLSDNIDRTAARRTVLDCIYKLRPLFRWADETGQVLSLESIEQSYRLWTDSLLQSARIEKSLTEATAYDYAKVAGSTLDQVLGRDSPIIKTTRLRKPRRGTRAVGIKAEKQNLEETFALGHFLLDISDGLSVDAIFGSIPLRISLRNGVLLEEWSGLKRPETNKPPNPKYPNQTNWRAKNSEMKRASWEADRTLRTRAPLVNLRMQAEMFMLMGQPGINLAQVHKLRMDQWRYKASSNGFEIRTYKHRRWGPVVFEIYSQYRSIFERYLRWRNTIFPNDPDGLLFPMLGKWGVRTLRHTDKPPYFDKLKDACERAGVKYLPPSLLRNTNVNWMLRRTGDPNLTAEEKQHATQTLLGSYEKPSQQRAMVQIHGFWAKFDPTQVAAGTGACIGSAPIAIPDKPVIATQPDCLTPTGCLFCIHQREIDSLDHVWSLVSFRSLKLSELIGVRKGGPSHPAEIAVRRITTKLNYISDSSSQRDAWVKEALLRIEEGRYHPAWVGIIQEF